MGNISEAESRLVIKLEGIDYLDIRFLSSFLYWFKVYSTRLNKKKSFKKFESAINEFIKNKNVVDLQELEQKLAIYLEEMLFPIYPRVFESRFFWKFFWEKEPLIYIENIKKGSWKIYIVAATSIGILLFSVAMAYKIVKAENILFGFEKTPKTIKVILNIKE